jgi:regulator of cell morphogenesis and NO signaling
LHWENKNVSEASERINGTQENSITGMTGFSETGNSVLLKFDKCELDFIIDHIINTHHRYAKKNAIVVYNLMQKIADLHGDMYPGLPQQLEATFLFLHDLLNHISREENLLFPCIKQLSLNKKKPKSDVAGLVMDSIALMEEHHERTNENLRHIRRLTNNYTLPRSTCNFYNYLINKLREFEDVLLLHVYLETKF